MKRIFKKIFSRFSLVALTIISLFVVFVLTVLFGIYATDRVVAHFYPNTGKYLGVAFNVLSWILVVVTVLHAANRDMVPETKIPWIICIIVLQIFGVAIYLVFSWHRPSKKSRLLHREIRERALPYETPRVPKEIAFIEMGHWAQVSEALSTSNPSAVLYPNTYTEYFPSGAAYLSRLLHDLDRAKSYIFLEFFIIEKGKMWDSILAVLERKVKEGVEVRVMYDDIGCMSRLRFNYYKQLREKGIDCVKFNPFVPVVSNVHNNRDHRKIVVIDGTVGYTGGLNLADEYIGEVKPFGEWKDTAVRLEGEGVRGLLFMFLRLFDLQKRTSEDFGRYLPARVEPFVGQGFVQPYGDGPSPLYDRHLGEDVYVNILSGARHYVWLTTPYLIIDYRLRQAMISAAKRGVDVRVMTPHIPDKKIAFALTRSNYAALIKGGVKVYEFTPGFVHAKGMIADDEIGVVGTINLDYRSFLYHFEDAVLMYKTEALKAMKADMVRTFSVSALQTQEDAKRSVVWRWICEVAKIFAPLF